MPLLDRLTIRNFKSFREQTSFKLASGSYFVGVNNSGKSTILDAIRFFFDDSIFDDESFVNKTSFLSKKAGSNQVEITIGFNLEALTQEKSRQRLIKEYGSLLDITKVISITTDTKVISRNYKVDEGYAEPTLPDEIQKLVNSVKVTYLHPQEGQLLLSNAQEKLKQRLLANWGLGSNVTQSIRKLKDAWEELRKSVRPYLSRSLTESAQEMWPESEVTINLPKDIKDIIAVSDINFSGYESAPEIPLTSQGTGAQSTILYLTHFLLDSDRSLHRGEYHPLWLLEEPESFLHVDLLANLARQLNSEKWLSNIQMVVSTHSPVLLAGSRAAKEKVIWNILSERGTHNSRLTTDFTDDEIKDLGKLMGDPNFFAYFLAAQDTSETPIIFVEDEKSVTVDKYLESGITITKGLRGVTEVSKILDVFTSMPYILNNKYYFIVDSDEGKHELRKYYDSTAPDKSEDGFTRFKVKNCKDVYLIFLPDNFAAEGLFSEFEPHLHECIAGLWDTNWKLKNTIPSNLSSIASHARRHPVSSKDDAISFIKNKDDVKSLFWEKVKKSGYKMDKKYITTLKQLVG